jgi:hypothetical protein
MTLDDISYGVRQKLARKKVVDEKLVEKYEKHINDPVGIFTRQARGNLLGITLRGRKIWDTTTRDYDFWFDMRTRIKNALVDLELFIETANDKDLNEVLNKETLEPIVKALLWRPIQQKDPEEKAIDTSRVEIARLFFQVGNLYLMGEDKEFPWGKPAG